MVHRTLKRDKIKLLSARARELDDMLTALSHEYGAETPDLKSHQKQLNEIKVKKKVGKNKFLVYWFAALTINNKAHNAYLGSCAKMDAEIACKRLER